MPKRVNDVRADVISSIRKIDNNNFKDQITLVPMVEVQAMLINAVNKMDQILKEFEKEYMEDIK